MMKVTTQLTIGCGCGFKARTGKEAADHCAQTGHSLSVNGTVTLREVKEEKLAVVRKAVTNAAK